MAKGNMGPAFYGKIVILVLGIIILGVGLHSHFKSSWTEKVSGEEIPELGIKGDFHVYEICKLIPKPIWELLDKSCPAISMEHYFVSIIIISFIISLALVAASFVIDLGSRPMKFVDLGLHGVLALLLFIAGVVYIISAKQIDDFTNFGDTSGEVDKSSLKLRTGEKFAAAALTIIQSLLYGVVAILIFKS